MWQWTRPFPSFLILILTLHTHTCMHTHAHTRSHTHTHTHTQSYLTTVLWEFFLWNRAHHLIRYVACKCQPIPRTSHTMQSDVKELTWDKSIISNGNSLQEWKRECYTYYIYTEVNRPNSLSSSTNPFLYTPIILLVWGIVQGSWISCYTMTIVPIRI